MPIADMSGSTRNAIDASQMQGAVNSQNRQELVGAATSTVDAAGEAVARQKFERALAAKGLDPMLARDPHTALTALLEAHREDIKKQEQGAAGKAMGLPGDTSNVPTQIASNLYDQGQETARQKTGFAHADASQQAGFANKTAEDTAVGGQVAALSAPTVSQDTVDRADPNSPNFDPMAQPTMGEVGQEGVDARAARMPGVRASAIAASQKGVQMGTGKPLDPALEAQRQARAKLYDAQAGNVGAVKPDQEPTTAAEAAAMGHPDLEGIPHKVALEAMKQRETTARETGRQAFQGGQNDQNRGIQRDRIAQIREAAAASLAKLGPTETLKRLRGEIDAETRSMVPDDEKIKALEAQAKEIEGTLGQGAAPPPIAPGATAPGAPPPAAASGGTPEPEDTKQIAIQKGLVWDAKAGGYRPK